MTEIGSRKTEGDMRCQAMTSRGRRCRNKAVQYRIHEDGREYLSCKLHVKYFRPHPAIVREKAIKEKKEERKDNGC